MNSRLSMIAAYLEFPRSQSVAQTNQQFYVEERCFRILHKEERGSLFDQSPLECELC